jgi:hypothetical protein
MGDRIINGILTKQPNKDSPEKIPLLMLNRKLNYKLYPPFGQRNAGQLTTMFFFYDLTANRQT